MSPVNLDKRPEPPIFERRPPPPTLENRLLAPLPTEDAAVAMYGAAIAPPTTTPAASMAHPAALLAVFKVLSSPLDMATALLTFPAAFRSPTAFKEEEAVYAIGVNATFVAFVATLATDLTTFFSLNLPRLSSSYSPRPERVRIP
jgi:hypothetical protein